MGLGSVSFSPEDIEKFSNLSLKVIFFLFEPIKSILRAQKSQKHLLHFCYRIFKFNLEGLQFCKKIIFQKREKKELIIRPSGSHLGRKSGTDSRFYLRFMGRGLPWVFSLYPSLTARDSAAGVAGTAKNHFFSFSANKKD